MRHLNTIGALAPCLLLGLGCEQVTSTDVRTDGIYADFEVVTWGEGVTTVSGSLRVGGGLSNTYLDLAPGDTLTAYRGDEQVRMRQDTDLFGAIHYRASFESDSPDTYRVAFLREHDPDEEACLGADAPYSFATMPEPFAMQVEAPEDYSAYGDDLVVTWTTALADDPMRLAVAGDCITDRTFELDDSGSLVIEAGELEVDTVNYSSGCELDLTVSRTRVGQLDPGYGEGGVISAVQRRGTSLSALP